MPRLTPNSGSADPRKNRDGRRSKSPLVPQPRTGALRLVIGDDNLLFRDLLVDFLCARCSLEFVAELSAPESVGSTCRELHPDVLLININMHLQQRPAEIEELRKVPLPVRVLVYSGAASDAEIVRAVQHGVDGFVSSANSSAEFLKAIDHLSRGDNYFCPHSSRILAEIAAGKHTTGVKDDSRLSPREQEILQLIASGNTSKEIAATLGLSVATVDTHRRNAMSKIGARNAADLIRYGYENGLIAGTVAALKMVAKLPGEQPSR